MESANGKALNAIVERLAKDTGITEQQALDLILKPGSHEICLNNITCARPGPGERCGAFE